jgi:hypothetical protein
MVTAEMLEKFKQLYFKKYNVRLNNEEATEMANGLVNLMEVLLKPTPNKEVCEPENERSEDETLQVRDNR